MSSAPVVHRLIASTAMEMAGAVYEEMASDDTFYRYNKSQKRWMDKNWGRFVDAARTTLAGMLDASHNYSQIMKDEIYEALLADATLPNGGLPGQVNLMN